MAVRRLAEEQPASFAFSAENGDWVKGQIAKYPQGRQASAVIPLLWRAQEQEGWVTKPAIEEVARILDMPTIRVLEVATFYTMFHLEPVGSTAHIQVCGTTPCMLRGSEELIAICKRRIAAHAHELSADGRFSWEEMECLGACVNAPMIQIDKATFEDLTPETFEKLLDALEKGKKVTPGPQVKRQFAAPETGLTSLNGGKAPAKAAKPKAAKPAAKQDKASADKAGVPPETPAAAGENKGKPVATDTPESAAARAAPAGGAVAAVSSAGAEAAPQLFAEAPAERDDLKKISGVGPKLEGLLNSLGIYRFEQVAAWTPENVAWVDNRLTFKGRILRDDWIGQARTLATGRGNG